MIDTQGFLLLCKARTLLSRTSPPPAAKRKLAVAITRFITLRQSPSGAIERMARRKIRAFMDVHLDKGEQHIRAHPSGVEIRTWCLIRHEELANPSGGPDPVEIGILALPERTRQILVLSQRHRLNGSEIAQRLGLSRRAVRRHLARAVRAVSRS